MDEKLWCRLFPPVIAWLLFLTLLSGCRNHSEAPADPTPAEIRTLRIGLIPEYDIFSQKKRYDPLAEYLSEKTGVRIELKVLSRYGNILDNFRAEKMEGAFLGSFSGALVIRKLDAEPLARPELADGTSTYFGMIMVRKDSEIRSVADMRGKRFAFVDKATTAGWLLPLFYFHQGGISNYGAWLGELYFAGTHENVIYDVLNRRADAGAAKNTVFDQLAGRDKRVGDELRILAVSPRVAENALVISRAVDEDLRQKLKDGLLQMEQDAKGRQVLLDFGAARFIETTIDDYSTVFEFAARVGLDLDTYEYLNQ